MEMTSEIEPPPAPGENAVGKCARGELARNIPLWKRVFDLTWILLAAPFWLPLMVVTAVAVKVASPGAVFYRQWRVGHRGRHFLIWKFRTMKVNAPTMAHESHVERLIETDAPMTKMDSKGDPRMIPGAWLMRASGLDELPQLLNVIRGEMSLVGPRPCIPSEFERYKPEQKRRVAAPPGLTGLWQVKGKNKLTFSEMIRLDLKYCDSMSLRQDTAIMLQTLPAILDQVIDSRRKQRPHVMRPQNEQDEGGPGPLLSTN